MITDGRVAAIGAPGTAVGNANRAGAVFFFTRADDGTWTAAPEPLTAAEAGENGGFGSVLYGEDTEDGFRLVVGAPGAGGVGIAYTFTRDGDAWRPEGRLYPPVVAGGGRSSGQNFANALAAVDGEIWIGGFGSGAGREGRVLRYSTDSRRRSRVRGRRLRFEPGRRRRLRRRRRREWRRRGRRREPQGLRDGDGLHLRAAGRRVGRNRRGVERREELRGDQRARSGLRGRRLGRLRLQRGEHPLLHARAVARGKPRRAGQRRVGLDRSADRTRVRPRGADRPGFVRRHHGLAEPALRGASSR